MSLPKKKGGDKPDNPEDEIITLVAFIKNVDDLYGSEAFAKVRSYLDQYIKLFSKKYRIAGHDADEIEQECLYALRYKAVEDFDASRGKFRSFAILCIKRHLYSIIKGNNQQKRKVLNTSISLDSERGDENDHLSLINLVVEHSPDASEGLETQEDFNYRKEKLLSKLSLLEKEVCKLYLKQYRYDEIVAELKAKFPGKHITRKTIDNSLVRARSKAQYLLKNLDWL